MTPVSLLTLIRQGQPQGIHFNRYPHIHFHRIDVTLLMHGYPLPASPAPLFPAKPRYKAPFIVRDISHAACHAPKIVLRSNTDNDDETQRHATDRNLFVAPAVCKQPAGTDKKAHTEGGHRFGCQQQRTGAARKMDEAIAASNVKQTQAMFLPQLGFSYTAMTTNNPLNAFGFKLQQQSITAADFNPALLNNPGGTSDFMTKIQLQQPLVNTDMLYQRKSAEKQAELYRYKTTRTKEYIRFEVEQAYLQLQLAYDTKAVLEEALHTASQLAKSAADYYNQGWRQNLTS